ncbi:hypothetical protein D918_00857 [Trichuris suis]|nr:hypothetical protein D918_00857 [Trichuris suis]
MIPRRIFQSVLHPPQRSIALGQPAQQWV